MSNEVKVSGVLVFHGAEKMVRYEAYAALAAEVEALRADAERYRFLRTAETGKPVVCTSTGGAWNAWLNGPELDAAIDNARK